jgi:glutamine amidotransferase
MCEIFGISSKERVLLNEYLKEFFRHSNAHPHGWGLACMDRNAVSVEKEPIQATKSHYLKARLSSPIRVRTGFAHIRYATIGNVEYENCHPYTKKDRSGRQWTMVHNGTIFDFAPLSKYVKTQAGDTDSERILLYLVDQVNQAERKKNEPLTKEERFQLLDSIVIEMAKGNKLNLLIFDGEIFYVHTNYTGSLHKLEKEDQVIFSTQPLTREEWQPETMTTLLAYEDGQRILEGTNHKNEYIDSEENMQFLYRIFSDL